MARSIRLQREKQNFWTYAQPLFTGNVALPVNSGLAGTAMPGAANTPQPMTWGSSMNWFEGLGIPIIPIDRSGSLKFVSDDAARGAQRIEHRACHDRCRSARFG